MSEILLRNSKQVKHKRWSFSEQTRIPRNFSIRGPVTTWIHSMSFLEFHFLERSKAAKICLVQYGFKTLSKCKFGHAYQCPFTCHYTNFPFNVSTSEVWNAPSDWVKCYFRDYPPHEHCFRRTVSPLNFNTLLKAVACLNISFGSC